MAVLLGDIKIHAAAVAPEDDVATQVGGAPDLAKKHDFSDVEGGYQIVSASAADTTQTVTLTYRNFVDEIVEGAPETLTGQTPVIGAVSIGRIMKAMKSATCAGDVALEARIATREGIAQGAGPGTDTLQLDVDASAVDAAYVGQVVRLTFGPGTGEIAYGVAYDGTTKVLTVSREWTTPPTSATSFRLANGLVFDRQPSEIMSVVRMFYDAFAPSSVQAERKFYQKILYRHSDQSGSGLSVTNVELSESFDGAEAEGADIKFDVDDAPNTASDNGVGNNRQVAPAGYTFDDAAKPVNLGGSVAPGEYVSVWLELTLAPGQADILAVYTPQFSFSTPL